MQQHAYSEPQRLSSFSLHCRIRRILLCPHCPVSSAGGLSCKHLSKGGSLSAPLSQKHSIPGLWLFRGGFSLPLRFLFPPRRHSPMRTDLPRPLNRQRLCPRDAAGSVLASQGYRRGRKDPADLLVSPDPAVTMAPSAPPTRFPAKLGRVNIYQSPPPQQQWPGTEQKEPLTRAHAQTGWQDCCHRGPEEK